MQRTRLFIPNRLERLVENHYKSNKVSRVFGQLHYWSTKMPNGFYKFKEACKHPLYKKDQSWSESLNMTPRMFNPVFNMLVNHHKSKNDYRNSIDKFGGKMFCSYTERNTNKTYYFMDKEAVDNFLFSLTGDLAPSPSRSKEIDTYQETTKSMPSCGPRNQQDVVPLACAHQTAINTQTITSLDVDAPSKVMDAQREEEKLSSQKMVELWNSHTQDKVVWYSSTSSRLCKVLKDFFGGCLESFRRYCAAIGNTKFLMGKAPNSTFKAFFYWAIKPEVIKSIFQGAYGVGKIFFGTESEENKLLNEYNSIGYEILNVENKIKYSKQEIIDAQKKSIKEHQQTISDEIKNDILKSIEGQVNESNPTLRKILVNVQYDKALKNYSHSILNLCQPEDIVIPQELLDERNRLQERRFAIGKRLQQIANEKAYFQKQTEQILDGVS